MKKQDDGAVNPIVVTDPNMFQFSGPPIMHPSNDVSQTSTDDENSDAHSSGFERENLRQQLYSPVAPGNSDIERDNGVKRFKVSSVGYKTGLERQEEVRISPL